MLLSDLSGQAREESHVLGQIIPSSSCVQGIRIIPSSNIQQCFLRPVTYQTLLGGGVDSLVGMTDIVSYGTCSHQPTGLRAAFPSRKNLKNHPMRNSTLEIFPDLK